MTDAGLLRDTWTILEDLRGGGDAFPVREIADVEGPDGHPLCAIDEQWRRHLLIPVGESIFTQDQRSAGVQIRTHLLVDREQTRRFLDVVCLKPHLNELFSIVVLEILEAHAADPSDPSRASVAVLERWRELIEHELSPQLGLDRLIGLYGELWHLRELALRTPAAVSAWIGPLGARHDFVSRGVAFEVKASRTRRGRFVEIHGHDQLEPPAGGDLYLATMKVDPSAAGHGERVFDIVEQLLRMAVDRHLLLERLLRLGLRSEDIDRNDVQRFHVLESRVYRVAGDFPRITSASFMTGALPPGVLNLNYQLDLTSEPPWPLEAPELSAVYDRLAGIRVIA